MFFGPKYIIRHAYTTIDAVGDVQPRSSNFIADESIVARFPAFQGATGTRGNLNVLIFLFRPLGPECARFTP